MVFFSWKTLFLGYHRFMLDMLYTGTSDSAVQDILSIQKTHWMAIVSFLYFANAMKWQLFESPVWDESFLKTRSTYISDLSDASYIFPDWIALQLFSTYVAKQSLHNLNWTDFIPFFIDTVAQEHSMSLYLYQCYDPIKWKEADSLEQWVRSLQERFNLRVVRADQCLYSSRGDCVNIKALGEAMEKDTSELKIFLNCTWTPFQENWTTEHSSLFQDTNCIVFNAWWLIDYITGYEKRAPDFIVKTRVLETFWRILTKPKKNLHKFVSMFWVLRFLRKPVVLSDQSDSFMSWKSS